MIIKVLSQHVKLVGSMNEQGLQHSKLIKDLLPRCSNCVKEPITVAYHALGLRFCDRCAAETIVSCRKPGNGSATFSAKLIASSMSDPDNWEDTERASEIRTLVDYVRLVEDNERKRTVHL